MSRGSAETTRQSLNDLADVDHEHAFSHWLDVAPHTVVAALDLETSGIILGQDRQPTTVFMCAYAETLCTRW